MSEWSGEMLAEEAADAVTEMDVDTGTELAETDPDAIDLSAADEVRVEDLSETLEELAADELDRALPDGTRSWNDMDDAADSAAERAAEYVRSFEGFDKAADYVARHFEGDTFEPGDTISVSTRNQGLDGLTAENGVPFFRKEVELTDGLTLEGVFPDFGSRHHVELGDEVKDMSLHQQFSACRSDFQDHMFDDPEKLEGLTLGDMERMDAPQGYAPQNWTWNHNPRTGSFDLVSAEQHAVGHTGGNAFWGKQ